MAGSLAHIVDDDGYFTMKFIENLGDAEEALHECFHIIRALTESTGPKGVEGDMFLISDVCERLRFTAINVDLKADYRFVHPRGDLKPAKILGHTFEVFARQIIPSTKVPADGIVHCLCDVLTDRESVCNHPGLVKDWQDPHYWSSYPDLVNCEACRSLLGWDN